MSAVADHIFVCYANFYHPQTKFVKVMFSQVFVHRGRGSLSGGGGSVQGGEFLFRGGLCTVGGLCRGAGRGLWQEGLCPGGSLSGGVSVRRPPHPIR